MIGTYVAAALICAASLLVGRALTLLAGRSEWSWLEPAAGFGAVLTVAGVLARAPGHGTSATVGLILLLIAAVFVATALRREADRSWEALRAGAPVAIAVAVVLSIPFAVSGRWGLLGVGFNNDLGLHLAWAEWLRSGFGPAPDPGYPLGPHGLAVAAAAVPGIGLGQAFVGEIFAIGILTGLTALAALPGFGPGRRLLAATMVAASYLGASYFAQGAFKELAEALFVLAVAVGLRNLELTRPSSWIRFALPWLAIAGGVFFAYSFAGLAWPVLTVVLWSLTLPGVRRALAPRALARFLFRPTTLLAIVILAALAIAATSVGPFGFGSSFSKVAGTNTYGPVSPIEALGVWPATDYRLEAPGGAHLTGLAAAIGIAALLAGVWWWVRRRDLAPPLGLAACLLLYLAALPTSGDYSHAKALMIGAPLAMLVIVRPLLTELWPTPGGATRGRGLDRYAVQTSTAPGPGPGRGPGMGRGWRIGWGVLAVLFIGGAVYSSFLALRNAPVGPPGHGSELRAFLPIVHGQPVLYAGQDRYAAYELLGADTHVPLVEFPDPAVDENPEKPFDTGDAYSPIDFDSFSRGTLDSFPYVITGRAAWNSAAPPGFKRIASTPSFILWKRTGDVPEDRRVLLEGTNAGAHAGCASPEIRILLAHRGRATLFPAVSIGPKESWSDGNTLENGEETSQRIALPRGRWRLSLQYFSPFGLTLSAPGFHEDLMAALDGQRPNTISLANDGQFWPAGTYVSRGGRVPFTVTAAEPSFLQRLTGYDAIAYVGNLVAVHAGKRRIVPLRAACNSWIDSYESQAQP